MNYLIIFVLITIMFFIGFGIGLTIPFLLKKYFNISENNFQEFNELKEFCKCFINNAEEKLKKVDDVNELKEQISFIKRDISNLSKSKIDSTEILSEWINGDMKGDGMNGSSS